MKGERKKDHGLKAWKNGVGLFCPLLRLFPQAAVLPAHFDESARKRQSWLAVMVFAGASLSFACEEPVGVVVSATRWGF
ncbi:hypothetical protein LMH87_010423 [Akanthomyces muscarius]|uniref:Uncharacterized protein n=1 Tax=Akanthomyces muscarius TaxID=2231603 RepID=A0A9W8ULZ7_AKAMU|nr:hypothetical protein LMH87_010423 [Akanthomyces muscarius]KAJ4153958.1 hypothetical protein LMH87_010423 [Akanthomyces muscarius]